MSAPILVLIIVANLFAAVFVFGRVQQRSEQSRYRYTAWRVRDELVDARAAGRLSHGKVVNDYIERCEVTIAATDLFTPFRLLYGAWVLRRTGWEPKAPPSFAALPRDEREILEHASDTMSNARVRLILLGSPSGWFVSILVGIAVIPVTAWHLAKAIATTSPDREPAIHTVTEWSVVHFGSPVDVVQPLVCAVEQPGSGARY